MEGYKEKAKEIMVIGHKNPDTDSICSAICYADLKNKISGTDNYVPKRAGHLNEETHFVLNRFGVEAPEYIKDVRPQVMNIEIRHTEGIDSEISVRNAWKLMDSLNVVTLPITEGRKLTGLVSIDDIAKSYFETFDNRVLSNAKTSFANIVETLGGRVITGDESEIFDKGKMLIAAANPDMMESMIDEGDIVILGNRYESQLCAIEMEAKCLIICEGAKVSNTIAKIAKSHNCIIIETDYDTYTVARLMNQAIPVGFFMTPRDRIVCFKTTDYVEDIQEIMTKKRFRDFPIEDENGNYVGTISRRNLLRSGRKKVILVDHNEKNQAVNGIEDTEILEIIDHHRLGPIQTITPVFFRNQPLGCTGTIIYKMYQEAGINIEPVIAGLMCSAIISDTLIFKSPTCTPDDIEAAMELADIAGIDPEVYGRQMFGAGSNLDEKTDREIFYQDFKKFAINDVTVGVGQVNAMGPEDIEKIKAKEVPFIDTVTGDGGLDVVYFLMTDISTECSYVLCSGKNADTIMSLAFGVDKQQDTYILKNVVSRKKQFLPAIMEAMEQ